MTYRVMVDDNYHYMDESERTTRGEFQTLEAAIAVCKKIVNESLESFYKPGMKSAELMSAYTQFGEDPWVMGGDGVPFSAWDYARERCTEICGQG